MFLNVILGSDVLCDYHRAWFIVQQCRYVWVGFISLLSKCFRLPEAICSTSEE